MQPFAPLIIFGSRPRMTTLGKGEFDCPYCGQPRAYERRAIRNYFTLYFIPLFPIGGKQEIIECQFCHHAYPPDVLTLPTPKRKPQPLADQLNSLAERLNGGLSVEYAIADLTAVGLDRELARKAVIDRTGGTVRPCPTCSLTYAPSLSSCPDDATELLSTQPMTSAS